MFAGTSGLKAFHNFEVPLQGTIFLLFFSWAMPGATMKNPYRVNYKSLDFTLNEYNTSVSLVNKISYFEFSKNYNQPKMLVEIPCSNGAFQNYKMNRFYDISTSSIHRISTSSIHRISTSSMTGFLSFY